MPKLQKYHSDNEFSIQMSQLINNVVYDLNLRQWLALLMFLKKSGPLSLLKQTASMAPV
jgi:hypothetical protein